MNAGQTSIAGQVVPGAGQTSVAGVFTTQGAGQISVAGVFTQGAAQTPVAGLFSRSAGQTSIAVPQKPLQPALSNCVSPEFNDPKADVILVTPEKVSFHVDSYVLKAHSSFFRDMFDSAEQKTSIPLEESAPTITSILRILYGKPADLSVNTCKLVLDASDKYDFFHVINYVNLHGRKLLKLDYTTAWEVLKIAARVDDEDLAKSAIKQLTITESPLDWKPSQINEIGLKYFCGILRAIKEVPNNNNHPLFGTSLGQNWIAIGDRFRPVV